MIKSTLKRKRVSSTNRLDKKCITNVKKLSFEDKCKENTRQHFDDLKLGNLL